MRTAVFDLVHDLLLDPSFIEMMMTGGADLSLEDLIEAAVWVIASGTVSRAAGRAVLAVMRTLVPQT